MYSGLSQWRTRTTWHRQGHHDFRLSGMMILVTVWSGKPQSTDKENKGCCRRTVPIINHGFMSSLETRTVTSHPNFFPNVSKKHLCILINVTPGVHLPFPHHSIKDFSRWSTRTASIPRHYNGTKEVIDEYLGHSSLGEGWMHFLLY